MAFQANLPKFEAANCAVVGCSNDPVEKNTEFATKEGFAYPLLCDTDLAVAKAYDSAKPEGDAARRLAPDDREREARRVARARREITRVGPGVAGGAPGGLCSAARGDADLVVW